MVRSMADMTSYAVVAWGTVRAPFGEHTQGGPAETRLV